MWGDMTGAQATTLFQAARSWHAGFTVRRLSRAHASLGNMLRPISASHSFASNTCAQGVQDQTTVSSIINPLIPPFDSLSTL